MARLNVPIKHSTAVRSKMIVGDPVLNVVCCVQGDPQCIVHWIDNKRGAIHVHWEWPIEEEEPSRPEAVVGSFLAMAIKYIVIGICGGCLGHSLVRWWL